MGSGNSCIVKTESSEVPVLWEDYNTYAMVIRKTDLPEQPTVWQNEMLEPSYFLQIGPDCGVQLDDVVPSYPDTNVIANNAQWITYQAECPNLDYDIANSAMACFSTQYYEGLNPYLRLGGTNASFDMLMSAQRVYDDWNWLYNPEVNQLAFQTAFNQLWPLVYQQVKVKDNDGNWVDNKFAQAYLQKFLTENPEYSTPNIISVLNANYTDEVQQSLGFMNQSADCQSYSRLGNWLMVDGLSGGAPDFSWIWDETLNDKQHSLCDGTTVKQNKETFETTLKRLNWQNEAGFHVAVDPRTTFLRDPGFVGNPYWTEKDRKIAIMKSFGVTPDNPSDPGEGGSGEKNPWNDVSGYSGKLPKLGEAFNPVNPPYPEAPKKGGGFGTYTDPCEAAGPIEELLPPACAFFGFVVPYLILPKEVPSTYVLSGTLAYTFYYVGLDSFGSAAEERAIRGVEYYNEKAAEVLSTGLPAGLFLAFFDTGLAADFDIPADFKWILLPPVALFGNWFFDQQFIDSLSATTGVLAIITYPIALIEHLLQSILTGCVVNIFRTAPDCKCSTAEAVEGGKTAVAEQLLQIYGTTGEQYSMRASCLQGEMARGLWKSDDFNYPDMIGSCDRSTNAMNNLTACYSAGNWTVGPPGDVGGLDYRPYPAAQMWGYDWENTYNSGIWHCLDASNPSFLPPNPKQPLDKKCEDQYGKGFRWIDKDSGIYYDPKYPDGVCKNLQFPGPNILDPTGLQYPGAVIPKFPGGTASSSDCTIL